MARSKQCNVHAIAFANLARTDHTVFVAFFPRLAEFGTNSPAGRMPSLRHRVGDMSQNRHLVFGVSAAILGAAVGGSGFLVAWQSEARAADERAGSTRPNVIIVMTDDQGLGDFSFTGNPVLKTPNLDRFASQSVRLVDFHVCPMCSPTRGQLLTGLAALRNGATSVTAGRTFVRPGIPMLPEIFRRAGYKTGLFGKWHLGDFYPHRPIDKGFDESVYHLGWGMLESTPEYGNPLFDGRCFHNGSPQPFRGHCTDLWFDRAIAWIRDRKAKNEPFLCYIPTNAPHAPCIDAERYAELYRGKGPAEFFGMIAHVDQRFGDLERFLDESGLRANTIVIFMTDNGGTAGVRTYNAGLRAGKTTYYEGGHRVPCWIRWPNGGLGEPRDVDVPTQNTDLLPTLLELCGIAPPRPAAVGPDEWKLYGGVSLAGVLRGTRRLDDRMLFVQYGQTITRFDSCVIWNKWRLVQGAELYDISRDRAQQKSVAADYPEVLKQMRGRYEVWWKGVEPLLNDFVPISIGAPQQPEAELTSGDWEGIYADNIQYVRNAVGGPTGGHWHIQVEREGEYEFTLRRWPEQTHAALGAAYDSRTTGRNGVSKGFPTIARANLELAGLKQTALADPKAQSVALSLHLPAGRTKLKAWFQDESGTDLCGAFFVTVRKRSAR
jgi:arylsulfatase A-like enzyme